MSRKEYVTDILRMVFEINECYKHDELDFNIHVDFNGYNDIQVTVFKEHELTTRWAEDREDATLESIYHEVLNMYTEVADICGKRKVENDAIIGAAKGVMDIADKFSLSTENWQLIFRHCIEKINKAEKDGAENV